MSHSRRTRYGRFLERKKETARRKSNSLINVIRNYNFLRMIRENPGECPEFKSRVENFISYLEKTYGKNVLQINLGELASKVAGDTEDFRSAGKAVLEAIGKTYCTDKEFGNALVRSIQAYKEAEYEKWDAFQSRICNLI
jgi:hypothetical protein